MAFQEVQCFLGRARHVYFHVPTLKQFAERKSCYFRVVHQQSVFDCHVTTSTCYCKHVVTAAGWLPAFQLRALRCPITLVPITHTGFCGAGGKDFASRSGQAHLSVGFAMPERSFYRTAVRVAQQAPSMESAFYVLAVVLLAVGKHF